MENPVSSAKAMVQVGRLLREVHVPPADRPLSAVRGFRMRTKLHNRLHNPDDADAAAAAYLQSR